MPRFVNTSAERAPAAMARSNSATARAGSPSCTNATPRIPRTSAVSAPVTATRSRSASASRERPSMSSASARFRSVAVRPGSSRRARSNITTAESAWPRTPYRLPSPS